MPVFSPEFSNIFKTASFANIVSSIIFVPFRIGSVLLFLALSVYSLVLGKEIMQFWLAIFILNVMFEFFYRFKVLNAKPSLRVTDLEQGTNVAESLTLAAARSIIKAKKWDSVSTILNSIKINVRVKSFLQKASFNQEEVSSILKASESEKINIQDIILKAADYANKEKRDYIDDIDLLLSLFTNSKALNHALFTKEIKEQDLLNIAYWVRHLFEKQGKHFWERPPSSFGLGLASLWEGGWTLETEKYSRNITEEIFSIGVKNHLVGRESTILQVEEVLARSSKRNVILMGEPGIGKETVVYGLAEKSAHGNLPGPLKFKRFLELDLTSLLSSATSGVLEERIGDLLTEISHASDVVLYIPQIEYLTTSDGGGVDITGLLLNTLKSGNLQVIATTTKSAYRKNIETKGAFSGNFEIVEISEPDKNESIRIVEEAATNIEIKTKVAISYKAIERAIDLSQNYMVDKVLPGKAIDLLDEAATSSALKKESILVPELIEQIVSQKTKTPVNLARGEESKKLLNLEAELHKRVIGQDEAVKSVSEAIRRARTLKRDTSRPIGVFLFLGPTGVGKTETSKALASAYFGSEERLVREDMSEYQEENSINRLIGAPPGTTSEVGGQFTEKIRSNPFTVVLLDEIEKANSKIQQIFLPIFDEGKMEDSSGRKIIFTNTIIIATSNAGAEYIRESIQEGKSIPDIKKPLLEKLQRDAIFKPEFLNRFDDIVLFKPLTTTEVKQIVGLFTNQLSIRIKKQDINLTFDNAAIDWLAAKGFDRTYGARPLRRVIQNEVESDISKKILRGELGRGSSLTITARDGKLIFTISTSVDNN